MPDVLPGLPGNSVQMDTIYANGKGGFNGIGVLAQAILTPGFSVNSLRTNAVLRQDEWELLDSTLIEIARQRLILVGDLMSAGLRYNLANALGVTRVEWETISDMTAAEINMSGLAETAMDRVNFELTGIPIPIVSKDFFINARVLAASRTTGQPLDTTQVALATRLVTEKIEDLVVNGGFSAGAQGTIYGYTNHGDRNTGSVTASWSLAGTSGENIVSDAIEMMGVAHADKMFGPYNVYTPAAAFVNLADDYKANSDRTILERLQAIPTIRAVKPSDNMTTSNVVMVQMTSDVVDIIDGIQPVVIQWESKGGMQMNFKVMAIMVPRIKSDQDGKSGIVHYS